MSSPIVSAVSRALANGLTPIPPFSGPLLPSISALDFAGAIRLAVALRQFKAFKGGAKESNVEWVKDLWATWTVVYGGEILACVLLSSTPPSFLFSPTVPLIFVFAHFAVHVFPHPPPPSLATELPLAAVDGLTRSLLLCNFATSMVLNHPSEAVSSSPLALLVIATIIANGGFFLVNAFNMHSPQGWSLTTPPEVKNGWMAVDFWCAPLITGLYALLTNAQPFWTDLYRALFKSPGDNVDVKPWKSDDARALCATILVILFSARAVYNFGPAWWKQMKLPFEDRTNEKKTK